MNDLGLYINLIVEPTFEEFKRDPTVRRAFLACAAVYHAIDRVSFPKKPGNLRKKWGKDSLDFKLVDIVAHHFKHVKSDDEKIPLDRPGLPIARALGLSDADEYLDIRNLLFVMRDAIKFLHEQAGR